MRFIFWSMSCLWQSWALLLLPCFLSTGIAPFPMTYVVWSQELVRALAGIPDDSALQRVDLLKKRIAHANKKRDTKENQHLKV